jgi:hypothetical protein
MFDDDDMGENGVCIYCTTGTDSGQEERTDDE